MTLATASTGFSQVRSTVHSDVFALGGDLPVCRLGYGAMQLTGRGVWGEPEDHDQAVAVLRRAVALGVNFIDTADAYGPEVSESVIAEALRPYPADLVIATKGGVRRPGPDRWVEDGRPESLRKACEASLRRLQRDRIDLYQLHRIDPMVPLADQIGALADLRRQGKIRHSGVSDVIVPQIEVARQIAPIVSVQNRYNLADRNSEEVVDYCTGENMAFIAYYPLAIGFLAHPGGLLGRVARSTGAQPAQLALAWLLQRSPVLLAIPGTSKITHLEENVAAAQMKLPAAAIEQLEQASATIEDVVPRWFCD